MPTLPHSGASHPSSGQPNAFMPPGFHPVAALLLGITAGFWEEVLFRAFRMTEFANAATAKPCKSLCPAFGLAHAGYLNQGLLPWLGIMIPTAFLGTMWGIAYLLERRSLLPVVVAHFLNDARALPWIAFFMVTGRWAEPRRGSLGPTTFAKNPDRTRRIPAQPDKRHRARPAIFVPVST